MAELFTNPMTSMTEAYKGTTSMLEDIASSQDLKTATEQVKSETPTIDESGNAVPTAPTDLFKVNSLAAQMAAERGDTRSSDKFMKQANEYKKDNLTIQSKEISVAQEKLEAMEQQVNSIESPVDAIDAVMKSQVPQERKLAEIAKIRSLGDDPEKFKVYKANLQNSVMTAKDRLTAEQRTLKMKQDHEDRLEQRKIQLERVRTDAILREGMLKLQQDKFDWQKDFKESELNLKAAKTEVDVDKNLEREKSKVDKDPLLKPDAKARRKAELDAAAERQKEILRGRKDGGGKKDDGKDQPTIPEGAVNKLKADPTLAAAFDKKYGTPAMPNPSKEILARK